ncbi:MAG: adenylate/guanylate cyclase domain-containing protein, partial [Acidobacteriota bacterium]
MTHAIAHAPDRKLATIMFTDIVGYSSQTQENEALALELLEEHRRLLRPIFHKHGGTEIKTIGDAFLVEFASALAAALCGIEMQKTLCERNAFEPPERRIQIRIGMHLGDVEHRDNDVYGDGVNIASRIETLAAPGGVYISEDVARQIQNKIGQPILRLGRSELKNIQLPVEIYRIALPWERTRPVLSQRLSFSLKRKNVSRAVMLGLVFFVWVSVTWWREAHSLRPPAAAEAARSEAVPASVDQVHSRLRAFLDGNIPAADLRIIYYDLHPIFGIHAGPWIAAKGTGEIQQDVEEANRPQDLSRDEIE